MGKITGNVNNINYLVQLAGVTKDITAQKSFKEVESGMEILDSVITRTSGDKELSQEIKDIKEKQAVLDTKHARKKRMQTYAKQMNEAVRVVMDEIGRTPLDKISSKISTENLDEETAKLAKHLADDISGEVNPQALTFVNNKDYTYINTMKKVSSGLVKEEIKEKLDYGVSTLASLASGVGDKTFGETLDLLKDNPAKVKNFASGVNEAVEVLRTSIVKDAGGELIDMNEKPYYFQYPFINTQQ